MAPQEKATPGMLASLLHYRWLALTIVVAVTALSGVGGFLTQAPASATVTLSLKTPGEDNVLTPGVVGDASMARYTEQRAQFVTNDMVLGEVAATLGGASISQLRQRITAQPITGTNAIEITADGPSADEAVLLANTTVAAYRSMTAALTDELRRKASEELAASQEALRGAAANSNDPLAEAAATALADLQRQGAELRVNALVYEDGVDFVNAARAEDADVPGWPLRALAIGFVLGTALAGVVTWMRADRERRITDANAPVAVLDAPLLGVVPRADKGASLLSSLDARPAGGTELALKTRLPQPQYQLVAAALMRRAVPGVVAVISPPGSADRPETTLNVAIAIAAEGGRVLVVDADPAASLSTRLRALERATEGDDWTAEVSGPDTVHAIRVREDIEVHVVTPNAGAGIGMPAAAREFADRILADHEKYEMVLIDSPSIETTPLVAALTRVSTGILAVVPRGCDESSVADIRRTAEIYSTPLVGFVYTGARGFG